MFTSLLLVNINTLYGVAEVSDFDSANRCFYFNDLLLGRGRRRLGLFHDLLLDFGERHRQLLGIIRAEVFAFTGLCDTDELIALFLVHIESDDMHAHIDALIA